MQKSYNFGDKIQLLKQLSEEISNKKRGLNKEEMANYEAIFKQKSDVNYTIGDYVVLTLWDVFKECLIKEQIDLLIKFNSNYDRYLEYCIRQLNFETQISELEDMIVEQARENKNYFEGVRNNQMNKKLMNIRKVIEKTEGPEIASTSIYMEFEDNTTANLYNAKTRTISKISFSNKLSILKLYMKKIIEGNFEHDDLAWLNILFNEVNTEKEQREKDLNDLWGAIRMLIFTKNKNIVNFVSAKLEEINDEDKKVKEYAL